MLKLKTGSNTGYDQGWKMDYTQEIRFLIESAITTLQRLPTQDYAGPHDDQLFAWILTLR